MKILDFTGLQLLCQEIKQIREASSSNGGDVSALRDDLKELASQLTAVLSEVGECIDTLDSTKAYIDVKIDTTLAIASWVSDASVASHPYKYTLALGGVTPDTRADLVLNTASAAAAGDCGMSPSCETISGGVVFRSKTVPAVALSGQLYITQGAEETTE